MIDGAGLFDVLPQLGMMLVWTVLPFVVALKVFRWS